MFFNNENLLVIYVLIFRIKNLRNTIPFNTLNSDIAFDYNIGKRGCFLPFLVQTLPPIERQHYSIKCHDIFRYGQVKEGAIVQRSYGL